jgi:hypothetical protein
MPVKLPADAEQMKEIRFLVPLSWWAEVDAAARARRFSIADLMRQLVRNFMLDRYDESQQALLREQT